ncbi:uncharacterized protein LOC124269783 [Haliotis rubra]|uniref:uncharacterized protein LOC124269783 n=1 Tax=Haliotis rubra TaxID=36100 RepID=UPI001EE4F1CE|nr:uncharacterized protein LOC124269783 [Haliotis rubra]
MGHLTNVYALVHRTMEGEPEHSAEETDDEAPTQQSDGDGVVNVGDPYAVPYKAPQRRPAVGGVVNADDLYAVPDKTPKHHPAVDGVVNVADLYAVPNKSKETRKETYSVEINSEYSEI